MCGKLLDCSANRESVGVSSGVFMRSHTFPFSDQWSILNLIVEGETEGWSEGPVLPVTIPRTAGMSGEISKPIFGFKRGRIPRAALASFTINVSALHSSRTGQNCIGGGTVQVSGGPWLYPGYARAHPIWSPVWADSRPGGCRRRCDMIHLPIYLYQQ